MYPDSFWPESRLKREAIENPAKREEIEKEMSKIKTEMEEQSGVKIDYIKESLKILQKCRDKISTEEARSKVVPKIHA